jgi:hypothetical protein
MFAYVLGCTLLAALLATPVVAESSDHALGNAAVGHGDVNTITTIAPQGEQAWDVEFPSKVMIVLFDKPTKVGDRILMGRYLIEHDNRRMTHGWPCTYLYDADDPRLPVVAFRCRHLTRATAIQPTVIVRSVKNIIGMRELVGFQFTGEAGAHGVPTVQ